MIKHDPQRKAIRLFFVIFGLLSLLVVLMFGTMYRTDTSTWHAIFPLSMIELLLFVLIIAGMFLVLSLLRRIDRRRVRAMQGDQALLAAQQPVPNEMALATPTTIQLKSAGGYLLFVIGMMGIIPII